MNDLKHLVLHLIISSLNLFSINLIYNCGDEPYSMYEPTIACVHLFKPSLVHYKSREWGLRKEYLHLKSLMNEWM